MDREGRIRDISNPSGRQLERRQSITEADVNLGPIIRCRGVSRILTCRRLDSLHAFTDGFEMSSPTRSSRIDSPPSLSVALSILIRIRHSFLSSVRLISYTIFGGERLEIGSRYFEFDYKNLNIRTILYNLKLFWNSYKEILCKKKISIQCRFYV